MKKANNRGFTLIEMLVVIGIIAILVGTSIAGFSGITKSAEKAKGQELVANAATALTALFQEEGCWPKKLAAEGKTDGRLDEKVCVALAKSRYFSLSYDAQTMKLTGHDRFGILTPWGATAVKRIGVKADLSTKVNSLSTVEDHVLYYALDLDGDGVIKGANVGGESVDVRATAIVWSIGKSGGNKGKPWPYKTGLKKDDIYSWTPAQTKDVK